MVVWGPAPLRKSGGGVERANEGLLHVTTASMETPNGNDSGGGGDVIESGRVAPRGTAAKSSKCSATRCFVVVATRRMCRLASPSGAPQGVVVAARPVVVVVVDRATFETREDSVSMNGALLSAWVADLAA